VGFLNDQRKFGLSGGVDCATGGSVGGSTGGLVSGSVGDSVGGDRRESVGGVEGVNVSGIFGTGRSGVGGACVGGRMQNFSLTTSSWVELLQNRGPKKPRPESAPHMPSPGKVNFVCAPADVCELADVHAAAIDQPAGSRRWRSTSCCPPPPQVPP
jgi:hypothetical protein